MRRAAQSEALNAPFAKTKERARPQARRCMAADCQHIGDHRAPASRHQLNQYLWFCLDHVREYNARWDYYKGMSQADIEREIKEDVTWHRPTWRLGSGEPRIVDPFGFFQAERDAADRERKERERRALSKENAALAVLELRPPATYDSIKARYKALVKQLHPDANGGDRSAEERLKIVNQAYSTLKAAYAQLAS